VISDSNKYVARILGPNSLLRELVEFEQLSEAIVWCCNMRPGERSEIHRNGELVWSKRKP
jgi:hypothetical protein